MTYQFHRWACAALASCTLGMGAAQAADAVPVLLGKNEWLFTPYEFALSTDVSDTHPFWVRDGLRSLAAKGYDYVLLDTPPGPSVYLPQALHAAHRALVVVLADAASFATIPRIQSLLEEYTAERADFLGWDILLNQMPSHSKLGHMVRSALYAGYAKQMVPVAVHKDHGVPQALAFERPVLQYEPSCPASVDIQSVADWLIDSSEQ